MAAELPFQDFLGLLRTDGIEVGLGDYQALGTLLSRIRTTDPATLGTAIAALLARNPAESLRIRELFAVYCELQATEPPPPSLPPPAPAPPRPSWLRRYGWVVILLLLSCIGTGVLLLIRQQSPTGAKTPPDLAAAVDASAPGTGLRVAGPEAPAELDDGGAPSKVPAAAPDLAAERPSEDAGQGVADAGAGGPPTGRKLCAPPAAQDPQSGVPNPPKEVRWEAVVGLSFGVVLVLALVVLSSRARARRGLRARKQLAAQPGPAHYELRLRDLAPPLSREELDHLATLLDRLRFEGGASRSIDVRRSLLRRLRMQFPPLVFRKSQVRGTVLLLREESLSPAMRRAAPFLDALISGLRTRGITVRSYYYSERTDWLAETPGGPLIPIEDLAPLGPESVLVVAGPLAVSRHGSNGRRYLTTPDWLRALTRFPRRVWLSPMAMAPRDSGLLRALGIALFPLSARGLEQAARSLLLGEEKARAAAAPVPSPVVTVEHLARLRGLVELAPLATPELAELLRQRYASELPPATVDALLARSLDPSGETLVFASAEGAAAPAEDSDAAVRAALVRRYLLTVMDDSEPESKRSVAHLRWRLDRALLALQIPDPREVLHKDARAELAALLESPLFEEVTTVAAQHVRTPALELASLPAVVQKEVAAENAGWLRAALVAGAPVVAVVVLSAIFASSLWEGWFLYEPRKLKLDAFDLVLRTGEPVRPEILPAMRLGVGRDFMTLSASGKLEQWQAPTPESEIFSVPQLPRPLAMREGGAAVFADLALDAQRPESQSWRLLFDIKTPPTGLAAVRFYWDGTLLATSSGRSAYILDAADGHQLYELKGHSDAVTSIEFNPIAQLMVSRILTTSRDHSAKFWYTRTGDLIGGLTTHSAAINRAAYSPDGRFVVTASEDRTARLYPIDRDGAPVVFVGHTSSVASAVFRLDGKQILTASRDRTLRLWNVDGSGLPVVIPMGVELTGAIFSPDGRRIYTTDMNLEVRELALDGDSQARPLQTYKARAVRVVVSPDGRLLLTTSLDGTAQLWEVGTGRRVGVLPCGRPIDHPGSAAFSPDGKRILVASGERLCMYGVEAGAERTVRAFASSADRTKLATVHDDAVVRVWDLAAKRFVAALIGHTDRIESVQFTPDGKQLATGSRDRTARTWNAETGEPLATITGHLSTVNAVRWRGDGQLLATGSEDGTIQICMPELNRDEPERLYVPQGGVQLLEWSPSGRMLAAVARGSSRIHLFGDVRDARHPQLTAHTGAVRAIQFSADSSLLLSGSEDGTARLWQMPSGQPLGAPLRVPCGSVSAVAIDPYGAAIATGSSGGAVQLWNRSGQILHESATTHEGAVTALSFTADGGRLFSLGMDQRSQLYDLRKQRTLSWVLDGNRAVELDPAAGALDEYLYIGVDDYAELGWLGSMLMRTPDGGRRLPVPSPNRPHFVRATVENRSGEVLISRPLLIPAVTSSCAEGTCPPPSPHSEVKLTGSQLLAQIFPVEKRRLEAGESLAELRELVQLLTWRRDIRRVRIESHDDFSVGSSADKLRASAKAAQAVRSYLVRSGIAEEQITTAAYGDTCPARPKGSPSSQLLNSTIDILIAEQDGKSFPRPRCAEPPAPTAAAPRGDALGGLVVPGTIRINGPLPVSLVTEKVNASRDDLAACYEDQLRFNHGLNGKLLVEFEVDRNGETWQKLRVSPNTLPKAFVACIEQVVRVWKFEGALLVTSDVELPLMLVTKPTEKAATR